MATSSRRVRDVIERGFEKSVDGGKNSPLLGSRLHDFGMRGCTSLEQTVLGGVAHLLNFDGSDTMSAGYYAQVDSLQSLSWNSGLLLFFYSILEHMRSATSLPQNWCLVCRSLLPAYFQNFFLHAKIFRWKTKFDKHLFNLRITISTDSQFVTPSIAMSYLAYSDYDVKQCKSCRLRQSCTSNFGL